MQHAGGHATHMWIVGVAAVVALLLGWSVGWIFAFALVACGAMIVAVFLIGRVSAQATPTPNSKSRYDAHHS